MYVDPLFRGLACVVSFSIFLSFIVEISYTHERLGVLISFLFHSPIPFELLEGHGLGLKHRLLCSLYV